MDKIWDEMPLTDMQIKRLKPRADHYAVSDGRGLAIEVMPTGVASWRYRYQFKDKTEKVSLGQYPMLSLKEARTKRDEMTTLVFRVESSARQKQLDKVALANASTVRYFLRALLRRGHSEGSQRRHPTSPLP